MKLVGQHELNGDRDTLHVIAVQQRSRGQVSAALSTLERLQVRYPDYSRLHEERGHCFLALRDTSRAIESFERGVSINAALLSSWSALEQLHRANGDTQKASIAAQQRATLERLPAPLVAAGGLFADGDMAAARRILQEFLHTSGSHAEALRLLGRIALHGQQLEEAAGLFEQVLTVAPGYRAARADYVRTLIEQQRYTEAQQLLVALLEREPDHADYRFLTATIHAGLGQHGLAITIYQQILSSLPGWPHLYLLLGNSLKAVGRQQEAIDSYRAAAIRHPRFADAYWSLANLKTYRFAPGEIEHMRSLEAAPATPATDRYHFCFALGKALEDRAEYEESWHYYQRGNALRAAQTPYDARAVDSTVDSLIKSYRAGREGSGFGSPGHTPIFIVGLPRSGSTLVEQILASHSKVEGTQELPTLGRIARESDTDFYRLGERYIREARAYATQGRPFFIDKMPNNFWHIGLIHRMLPAAKIIDVRRDPLACCVSNLKQLYARGQDFTYRIDAVAHYYKSYQRLMNHWDEVLPERVLHVSYEDLVADFAPHVRRMLQFCELDWEPGCLQFYKTARSISTASSEQVRQPVFQGGLTRWRQFEPWLGELKEALA